MTECGWIATWNVCLLIANLVLLNMNWWLLSRINRRNRELGARLKVIQARWEGGGRWS